MAGPLAGIRVVELGVWVAGPSAGGVLADWGCAVVKLEPPEGDPFRGLYLTASGVELPANPPFELDNRGKRSLALDLRKPEALGIAYRLLDQQGCSRMVPGNSVDGGLSGGRNATLQTEQAMMGARGDDSTALGGYHDNLAVATDACVPHIGFVDLLAAKALDRISPQLGYVHVFSRDAVLMRCAMCRFGSRLD